MSIAFFSTESYDKASFEEVNAAFGFQIKYFDSPLTLDTCPLAQGHSVVCVFVHDILSASIIDSLQDKGVKLIALRCAGYNNVDLKAAKHKIRVVRVPSYSAFAVAEHAMGMILCLNRKFHHAYSRIRDNNFSIEHLMGFDLHGKTAGVIGCGKIGSVMVGILKGFGMEVLAYDIDKALCEKVAGAYTPLATLYEKSDIISLHVPLTKDNYHMINKETIAQMKPGVMLINTSRGGLIHTPSLIQGLKSEKLGAVGLDAYEEETDYFYKDLSESFIPDDQLARLQTFPNVLITAHQGFFTKEAMHNIALTTLENIRAFQEGKPLVNEIKE